MKSIVLAAALTASATAGFAGGVNEAIMEKDVVEAAASSADHDFVVPLMLFLVVLTVLLGDDDGYIISI